MSPGQKPHPYAVTDASDQMQCGCQILACHIEGVCHHSFDADKRGMWIHHHTDIVTSVGLESWKSAEVFNVCPLDRNHDLMLWLRPQINPKWLPQPCITYKVFAVIHMTLYMHVNPSSHCYFKFCWARFWKVSWKGLWCWPDRNHALMLWLRPQTNTKWLALSCLTFIRCLPSFIWCG